jgi:hypothetical protein
MAVGVSWNAMLLPGAEWVLPTGPAIRFRLFEVAYAEDRSEKEASSCRRMCHHLFFYSLNTAGASLSIYFLKSLVSPDVLHRFDNNPLTE